MATGQHPRLQTVEAAVQDLLVAIGEDPGREGLEKTPTRAARAYESLLDGYAREFAREITTFENAPRYDDIVISSGIDFYSICEHHLLRFWGRAAVAYIPGERVVGLSKLSRLVDIYAHRL